MKIKEIKNYSMLDFETTGLDPNTERIVEVGCLRVRDGEIVDTLSCLVNHKMPIPEESTRIHGITTAMVEKDGIEPFEACKQTIEFLGDDLVLGLNNIPFDYPFLEILCNKLRLPRPKIENFVDVGLLAKGIFIGNIYNEEEMFYKYAWRVRDIRAKGVKYNLNFLTKFYGLENLRENDVHGAIPDLKMTNNVFKAMQGKM